jgi:hypothetical protein
MLRKENKSKHTHIYMYRYSFLSIKDSCKSLFLLDTGMFFWKATRFRPCQPTFSPGFRFREYVYECVYVFSGLLR